MLRIAMVSSEAVPFAKTGGLADVVTALGKELVKIGNEVVLLMPLYAGVSLKPTGLISPLRISFGGRQITYSIVQGAYEGIKLVFVDSPYYFQRSGIYGDSQGGFHDNDERFLFFTRACLEYFRRKEERPDVFHCHDWPTGLLPLFLKTHYYHEALSKSAVVFTIHNIAYQGNFPGNRFSLLELGQEFFNSENVEFFGAVSYLKSGLLYSDLVSTVSRRYAQEIMTSEFGCRMQGVLSSRKERVFGVLNGIDEEIWDPESDPHIVRNFNSTDLSGKLECRRDLLRLAGWDPELSRPVIAIISRLALQKGLDLLETAVDGLLQLDTQLMVLGSGGQRYERFFQRLQAKRPDRVNVTLRFDDVLAHRMEAGADMFLMPSRYEPCGLNQMYSLRYGTAPIVRATGGLDDTVEEWNEESGKGNGFKFQEYDAEAMLRAVSRARNCFENKSSWTRMLKNGMSGNFSWRNSALQYMSLYDQAIQLKS